VVRSLGVYFSQAIQADQASPQVRYLAAALEMAHLKYDTIVDIVAQVLKMVA